MPLVDREARRTALTAHDVSLVVEAGAGTGKTSVMAGRVAMLLAAGVPPESIVAITFTELAAGELLTRVEEFVAGLIDGVIPRDLEPAFAGGLQDEQRQRLRAAAEQLDQIVCSTIHGFCQRLITPYPIEAGMDPGARIIDPGEAHLIFQGIVDDWLRERLSVVGAPDDLVVEMLATQGDEASKLLEEVCRLQRSYRTAAPPQASFGVADAADLIRAVAAFRTWFDGVGLASPDEATRRTLETLESFADDVARLVDQNDAGALLRLMRLCKGLSCVAATTGAFRRSGAGVPTKAAWTTAAKASGRPGRDGETLAAEAKQHYEAAGEGYLRLVKGLAGRLCERIAQDCAEVRERYTALKRRAALIDFDDLLHIARNLLREHPEIRRELAARHRCILVDEFQDTDALQAEIIWLLAGEGDAHAGWKAFDIRPGALFVVGDPKQAIYRFRGGDVATYREACGLLVKGCESRKLVINVNFRSVPPVLQHVNRCFKAPLSQPGQPGFQELNAYAADSGSPAVLALDVPNPNLDPSAEQLREAEARRVAELVRGLIGELEIRGRDGARRCSAGDIALLAPAGSDLWIYERALEDAGLPIATQAGKGLMRRQEIQDLLALTRVLADSRDTLALGALLRGPLVGLTEADLLDATARLPGGEKIRLWTDPDTVDHPVLRETLRQLRPLARSARFTTPFALLCAAVEALRVRPILAARHERAAERALANVELFLEMARPYAVRGLRVFARDMQRHWEDADRMAEGRPDSEADAVSIITIHSSKGLEFPVVVPINGMAGFTYPSAVHRRSDDTLHFKAFGLASADYDAAIDEDRQETRLERERLWYVGLTRARDLLVLPRHEADLPNSCWARALEFGLADLPSIDPAVFCEDLPRRPANVRNEQTAPQFVDESRRVLAASFQVKWRRPSDVDRDRSTVELMPVHASAASFVSGYEDIQGSAIRGNVLHKLMEEVLLGLLGDGEPALVARAEELLEQLEIEPAADPKDGPCPAEMAATVANTLRIPVVAAARPRLHPEAVVLSVSNAGDERLGICGIADALEVEGGRILTVFDWKSDVDPSSQAQADYRVQVEDYLLAVNASAGYVVYMSTGSVDSVGMPATTAAYG
ncbi:UvrD-helicase domain-containing protein [Azospirillum brasilense]|uniref:UvrD-helicase domain-containing protein n=1 Tax=Azospirillum brasilense TaxID=192 RepID=UPI001EDABE01|nr:UvrD-helicase domain-containing protein [Azospirillum brasilense]UKJ75423.1 UvrD-helicase domain-containing protein [Azospirillum brasilense]